MEQQTTIIDLRGSGRSSSAEDFGVLADPSGRRRRGLRRAGRAVAALFALWLAALALAGLGLLPGVGIPLASRTSRRRRAAAVGRSAARSSPPRTPLRRCRARPPPRRAVAKPAPVAPRATGLARRRAAARERKVAAVRRVPTAIAPAATAPPSAPVAATPAPRRPATPPGQAKPAPGHSGTAPGQTRPAKTPLRRRPRHRSTASRAPRPGVAAGSRGLHHTTPRARRGGETPPLEPAGPLAAARLLPDRRGDPRRLRGDRHPHHRPDVGAAYRSERAAPLVGGRALLHGERRPAAVRPAAARQADRADLRRRAGPDVDAADRRGPARRARARRRSSSSAARPRATPTSCAMLARDGHELGNHTFTHAALSTGAGWKRRTPARPDRGGAGRRHRALQPARPAALLGDAGRGDAELRSASSPTRAGSRYLIVLADFDSEDWQRRGVARSSRNATPPARARRRRDVPRRRRRPLADRGGARAS